MAQAVKVFLRVFAGQIGRGCSMARFPVEQFDKVHDLLTKTLKLSYSTRIGVCELDGYHVYTSYDNVQNKNVSFCIRRKNGEPFWNICDACISRYGSFSDEKLNKIFNGLKEIGVDLSLPSINFEYIPPIPSDVADKYRVADYNKWMSKVDPITIEEVQEMEKRWYEDALAKGSYN